MEREQSPPRALVTGGAGFIGSHVVDRLLDLNYRVTVYDNLSSGRAKLAERHPAHPWCRFIQGDILDLSGLREAMRDQTVVWHLAANTNIRAGTEQTDRDLKHCVIGTWNVLDAMRQAGVSDLLYASSGVVYGDASEGAVDEASGPLLPVSLYGAGKLSGELFISAYGHLFGVRAWMFRFANVIGERTDHGVVYDFVEKLRRNPEELEVLGDGQQLKPYILVDDCVDGMLYAYHHVPMTENKPCDVFNLGTDTETSVATIARIVTEEMRLPNARIHYTGGRRGWPGDAPVLRMSVEKLRAHGWEAKHSSEDVVRLVVRRMVAAET